MKAADRILAGRYARAFFEAAGAAKEAESASELSAASAALAGLLPALRQPLIPMAEKQAALDEALRGGVSELTRRFLRLLVEKKRLDLLPLIAEDAGRLAALKANRATAKVASAAPLSAADREGLRRRLQSFAGKQVELEFAQDPAVLGGVVVRLGDWVLDASLRGRLKAMRGAINGY
jgi:F-type H+-transporting ATPase subunit delta